MDEHALILALSATLTKTKVPDLVAWAENTNVPTALLHEVCYHQERPAIAFRAAWVLEHIATRYPERFMPVFDDFFNRLSTQKNRSCQRHFTKIVMRITHPKAPGSYREAYRRVDREGLVETLFGWLIDSHTPVAVQVNCMDILFHMSAEFSWIADELRSQIEFLMRDGSAAMQSRGRKIRDQLKQSKPEVDPNG